MPETVRETGPEAAGRGRGGLVVLGALVAAGLALLVVAVLVLVRLVDGGDGPSDSVEDFFADAKDRDCDVVEHFSNAYLGTDAAGREERLAAAREQCETSDDGGATSFDDTSTAGCDLDVRDEEVDGDTATVDYTISGCDEDANNTESSLDLVKEDGEWRIASFG